MAALEIQIHLENVIAEDGGDAFFECKMKGEPTSCDWTKNGRPIVDNQRIKSTSCNEWYRLEINKVKDLDHGLYAFTANNEQKYVTTAAILFVASKDLNARVCYTRAVQNGIGVLKHLRSMMIARGEKIELEVVFNKKNTHFVWYKNNRVIHPNNRIVVLNSKNSSVLSILESRITDAGAYCVVSKTKEGLLSSLGFVHVFDFPVATKLPIMEEMLPDEMETNEGEDARVICKAFTNVNTGVICTKNNITVPENIITIEDYGENYFGLKAVNVSQKDIGVYTIKLRDKKTGKKDFTKTYLSVLRNLHLLSITRVLLHSINGYLQDSTLGNRIMIRTENKNHAKIVVLNSKNSSVLSILESRITDAGAYCVVSKTKEGLLSSLGFVHVFDFPVATKLPIMEEMLPDEMETNEGEDARVICKAFTNVNTGVICTKNNITVPENIITIEDYGENYFGLKAVNVSQKDIGVYTIKLRDKKTGKKDFTKTYLSVLPCPVANKLKITRPLESAVASCGSKIIFDCSFAVNDPKYFYVVWHVGHFTVERTNSRFRVICYGGEYLLFIKNLEPGMCGEIVCELRKGLPNQRSVRINSCSAYLTVVPDVYQIEPSAAKLFNITHPYMGRFYTIKSNEEDEKSISVASRRLCYCCCPQAQEPVQDEANNEGIEEKPFQETELNIVYCRLTDDGIFFVRATSDSEDSRVKLYQKNAESNVLTLKWEDGQTSWYEVQIGQSAANVFVAAGVISESLLELELPPVGRVLRIRVRAIPVDSLSAKCSVFIATPDPALKSSKKHEEPTKELQTMQDFEAKYAKTGDIIGTGAFGSVILVRNADKEYYAAKVLKTKTNKKRETAQNEFNVMKKLRHPILVELIDGYAEKDVYVFVMDYLWGGELFNRIVKEDYLKEVNVIPYVKQICEGLQYLHSYKIAHLDLKPENIICLSPNSGRVKIIDFGIAKVIDEKNQVRAIYGTKDYVAPEVLNFERLSVACDMWSLGVVTYVLLSGLFPFDGDTWFSTSVNIIRANYNYDDLTFHEISDLAKDFVDHLLLVKPTNRMTATDALAHAWIREGPPQGFKSGPMKRTKQNLKSYLANYKARWQRAGNVLIAAHRLRTQANSQRSGAGKDSGSHTI